MTRSCQELSLVISRSLTRCRYRMAGILREISTRSERRTMPGSRSVREKWSRLCCPMTHLRMVKGTGLPRPSTVCLPTPMENNQQRSFSQCTRKWANWNGTQITVWRRSEWPIARWVWMQQCAQNTSTSLHPRKCSNWGVSQRTSPLAPPRNAATSNLCATSERICTTDKKIV